MPAQHRCIDMQIVTNMMGKPLFWAWAFVAIWSAYIIGSIIQQRWEALTISLIGLIAALLVVSAILSRRRKTLYPNVHGNHEPRYPGRH